MVILFSPATLINLSVTKADVEIRPKVIFVQDVKIHEEKKMFTSARDFQ
jgi:hypothetical protein